MDSLPKLTASGLGKKYKHEWIIRDFSYEFVTGQAYAIVGGNGSGKSTLLQLLSGALLASEGSVSWQGTTIEQVSNSISFVSPAQELIEEFTLKEAFQFHQQFKTLRFTSLTDLAAAIQLQGQLDKPIKYFSSGMKQRLKLGFAFLETTSLLLLDEPTSNLDARGIAWYQEQLSAVAPNKLVIISSNQPYEYAMCKEIIEVEHFKPNRNKHHNPAFSNKN